MFQITPNRIRVGPKDQPPLLDTEVPMPHLMGFGWTVMELGSSVNNDQISTFGLGNIKEYYNLTPNDFRGEERSTVVTRPDFLITRARFVSITGGSNNVKGQTIDSARFVPIGQFAPHVWFQGSQLISASMNEAGPTERKVFHVYVENGQIISAIHTYPVVSNYSTPAEMEYFRIELGVWYGIFGVKSK